MAKWQDAPAVQQQQARWQSSPAVEQAQPAQPPSFTDQVKRTAGLSGRTLAEGAMNVVAPFADATGALLNRPLKWAGADYRFPEDHTAALSHHLTEAGLPKPETGAEKASDFVSQLLVGGAAGAPAATAVTAKMGLNAVPKVASTMSRASSPAARTLEDAGVPLDRAQRGGGRFMNMLRSAMTTHPFTADRAAKFTGQQQRAFNRAVLRSIGADADEATQPVMAAAKRRIGNVFNQIGSQGAQFDDALQSQLSSIVDDALRTVPESMMAPVQRNVDDILGAVGDDGKINGEAFIRIRSHLSELADNADVGTVAQKLEQSMLEALERTYPGQRQVLRDAADQWRSMRIIQTAIGRGAERDISPLRLSNAMGTNQNSAMSVYGQGGDQRLVSLAQAGRSVLPQSVPDSGTVPRGLMAAPLRAIATAPLYRAAQSRLLAQPGRTPPGGGVLRSPRAVAMANALLSQDR